MDLLHWAVDEVVPRFVHCDGLDDDEGPSDSKSKLDEAEQTTRDAKAKYKEGWGDETAEDEAAQHQRILKALGSMGSGFFGRLAYHAIRTFEQARTPVTVPNVETAVVVKLEITIMPRINVEKEGIEPPTTSYSYLSSDH
jgi:hypothetical protein